MKFGTDRHRPPGEWVQATQVLKVAGIHHHKPAVMRWMRAIAQSLRARLPYGVLLEVEPNNPRDANAIRVIGYCDVPGMFGGLKRKTEHLGYIPADDAAETHADLISASVPIAGELYSVYWSNDDYVDVNIIVLAPEGHSASARAKRRRTT